MGDPPLEDGASQRTSTELTPPVALGFWGAVGGRTGGLALTWTVSWLLPMLGMSIERPKKFLENVMVQDSDEDAVYWNTPGGVKGGWARVPLQPGSSETFGFQDENEDTVLERRLPATVVVSVIDSPGLGAMVPPGETETFAASKADFTSKGAMGYQLVAPPGRCKTSNQGLTCTPTPTSSPPHNAHHIPV